MRQIVGIVREDGSIEDIPDPPTDFCRACGDPSGFALPDIEAINAAHLLLPRGSPIPRREPLCARCLWWSASLKLAHALNGLAEATRSHLRDPQAAQPKPPVARLVKFPAWLMDWWRRRA